MKGYTPGLLDRLLGEHAQGAGNGTVSRLSLDQLKASVARDLEALLNTRIGIAPDMLADFPECRKSIISYGLIDFAGFCLSSTDDVRRLRYGDEQDRVKRRRCASAIMQNGPWLVNDAPLDPRTISNSLIAGEFGLNFYLGVPLETHDGFDLGTLCVLDFQPRTVSQDQITNLEGLARVVMDQLELRLAARQSIAALSVAIDQKEAALDQANLMSKEIDHRVLNSLNLIVSLLGVQSLQLRGTPAASEIAKAAGKIMAVAQVHKHMQFDATVVTADCAEYLQRLCLDLREMLHKGETASIRVDAVPLSLPSEQIVRIGLIVNELVTNAVKQGAENLEVSLARLDDTHYSLCVTDDGHGLPANFVPEEMAGLGMKVVTSLVRNLGGRLSHGRAPGVRGTRFEVSFPVAPI